MTTCQKHNCWLNLESCQCDYCGASEEDKKKLAKQVKKLRDKKD